MKKKKGRFFLMSAPLLVLVGVFVFSLSAKRTVPENACQPESFSGKFDETEGLALFEGESLVVERLAEGEASKQILGVSDPKERWIEVDLSEQKLFAWDGQTLFLETPVSTGLPWWPTPEGEFNIWVKLKYANMEGGEGKYYYNLPNVPYVMYFENEGTPAFRGYGLHGTYWHSDFGTRRSHGCVNLPTSVAEKLYYWTTPVLSDGTWTQYADEVNTGTRIIIHQ